MTLSLKERAKAYLETADQVRAIDSGPGAEADKLARIEQALIKLAGRTELFPVHAFPRAEGTPGGLFRLVEYADQRDAVYLSLGFTGRSQTPHRHASWATVVGVTGGVETNNLYDFHDEEGENAARLTHRERVVVGPGEAVSVGTGVFHTIDVVSDEPVLHLHAYGLTVDKPGFDLPIFASPDARTYATRSTGGFRPPLSIVTDSDIRADLASGDAALLLLGDAQPPLGGPNIFRGGPEALLASALDPSTPVVVVGSDVAALDAAVQLYAAGWPLVFQYAAVNELRAAA